MRYNYCASSFYLVSTAYLMREWFSSTIHPDVCKLSESVEATYYSWTLWIYLVAMQHIFTVYSTIQLDCIYNCTMYNCSTKKLTIYTLKSFFWGLGVTHFWIKSKDIWLTSSGTKMQLHMLFCCSSKYNMVTKETEHACPFSIAINSAHWLLEKAV